MYSTKFKKFHGLNKTSAYKHIEQLVGIYSGLGKK